MDITFTCTKCGQHIVINAAGVGVQVKCPTCQADLVVPATYILKGCDRKNSNEENLATNEQRCYLAMLGVYFNASTLTKAEASLLISKEESQFADAIPETKPATEPPTKPATDKQKAYLRELGVRFDTARLSKQEASKLIADAQSKKTVTPQQIEKLRRLGLPDELEEYDSAQHASDELELALLGTPTETQLERAKELGFTIPEDADFSAGALDDILKLADRQPDKETLDSLRTTGIGLSKGTALEARMLSELVWEVYSTDRWEAKLPRSAWGDVCAVAVKDPAFYQCAIDNKNLGLSVFHWPESKLEEWFKSVVNTAYWEKETKLRPSDASGFLRLGDEYRSEGRKTDAIMAYKQAIHLAPSWISPRISLAFVYHNSGRFTDAEQVFTEARRVNPRGFNAWFPAIKGGEIDAELLQQYPNVFNVDAELLKRYPKVFNDSTDGNRSMQTGRKPTIDASTFAPDILASDSDSDIIWKLKRGMYRKLDLPDTSKVTINVVKRSDGQFDIKISGPDDLREKTRIILGL